MVTIYEECIREKANFLSKNEENGCLMQEFFHSGETIDKGNCLW